MKKLRDRAIFSKPDQLLKLSEIVENACSDDETDAEVIVEDKNQSGEPCVARILAWRSEKLRYAGILLDAYMEQKKASIPKSVRKHTGRPSRPQIRKHDAPVSSLPVPPGLPVDCYSSSWIDHIKDEDPLLYSQLEIRPAPVLDPLIKALEGL